MSPPLTRRTLLRTGAAWLQPRPPRRPAADCHRPDVHGRRLPGSGRGIRRQHRRSGDPVVADRQAEAALQAAACGDGGRGLLTSARIEQTLRPAGLDWITALRAPAIKQLAAEGGPLQPSLFDDRDMAEITSAEYPGERLVVCKNPLLAEQRARKRGELLAVTENDLARIEARVQRAH